MQTQLANTASKLPEQRPSTSQRAQPPCKPTLGCSAQRLHWEGRRVRVYGVCQQLILVLLCQGARQPQLGGVPRARGVHLQHRNVLHFGHSARRGWRALGVSGLWAYASVTASAGVRWGKARFGGVSWWHRKHDLGAMFWRCSMRPLEVTFGEGEGSAKGNTPCTTWIEFLSGAPRGAAQK